MSTTDTPQYWHYNNYVIDLVRLGDIIYFFKNLTQRLFLHSLSNA